MEINYYVYEYYALHDGVIRFNEETYYINEGDVYYVGKGLGNRVSTGVRNLKCEEFKKIAGFGHSIVKGGLTEEEALQYERELIHKYKEKGMILTNRLGGSIKGVEVEAISLAKYLMLLVKQGLIRMSQETIALESGTYHAMVNNLFNIAETDMGNRYNRIPAKCPDNIAYILDEYDTDKLSDRDIKFGNIKYVLNLLEKKVIKTNQREIADFYGESATVVSAIKKDSYQNISPIKPNNLHEILKKFDIGKLTEDEIKAGSIKYIIDALIEPEILNMTIMDLANELGESYGITYNWLQDLKRRRINVRHVKPSPEVLANLFHKYHDIQL